MSWSDRDLVLFDLCRHLDPDPVDEDPRRFDPERSSFSAHNSDNEGDCPEKEPMLPHGISGQGNFVEPGEMTPSPPTTPIKTSYSPVGRPRTPENGNLLAICHCLFCWLCFVCFIGKSYKI